MTVDAGVTFIELIFHSTDYTRPVQLIYAVLTATIRLPFDARSTAYLKVTVT